MAENHNHSHTPGEKRRQPISTYRLQLGPDLTFSQARRILPYLSQLGVTDVYCSPILQAAPGSNHGYDVVDHSKISEVMGGERAFRRFAEEAHELGIGIIVDVVPNHMAVPTPLYLNKAHAAGAYLVYILQIAKGGNINMGSASSFQNGRAGRNLEICAVDLNI